jgi:thiamine biosynthesis lipoprotein
MNVPAMPLFNFKFRAMAAENGLQLVAPNEPTARRVADLAIADVQRIESKYSRYRDDTITTRINRAAGKEPVKLDAETAALLQYADRCHRLSGGLFDVTSGVLRRVWDFKRKPPQLPDPAALAKTVALVNWSSVEWSPKAIRLPRAGMEIDFGGIGKEYAADRAAAIVTDLGGQHGLVNLGGDVRVIGPHADDTAWRIAVQDPRGEPGATIAYLDVPHGAMATSGDYERYFEHEGRRYSHLLDPRTGWPVEYWRSVSVVAPLAIAAGACATVAMLKPVDDALKFLDAQGVRYLAIDSQGQQHSK